MKSQTQKHIFNIIIIVLLAILAITGITSALIFLSHNEDTSRDIAVVDDVPGSEPPYNFDYSWARDNAYIAHAFGGIFGDSYTNSYEAFLLNYQLGHRVFEVDFSITDDGKTVAAHDPGSWSHKANVTPDSDIKNPALETETFTYDNFMSSLWFGKYHPVDLAQLFQIMKEHPDIYIVTDTKYSDPKHVEQQFSAFRSAAAEVDLALLDRFVVQIYNPDMLAEVMAIYPWKSVIYTLYNDPEWTPENVLEFSKQSGVKFITMWGSWVTADIAKLWQPANIQIAAHTINQLAYANQLRSLGVNVIYTDFLLP